MAAALAAINCLAGLPLCLDGGPAADKRVALRQSIPDIRPPVPQPVGLLAMAPRPSDPAGTYGPASVLPCYVSLGLCPPGPGWSFPAAIQPSGRQGRPDGRFSPLPCRPALTGLWPAERLCCLTWLLPSCPLALAVQSQKELGLLVL
jgi:hypothetical protein